MLKDPKVKEAGIQFRKSGGVGNEMKQKYSSMMDWIFEESVEKCCRMEIIRVKMNLEM